MAKKQAPRQRTARRGAATRPVAADGELEQFAIPAKLVDEILLGPEGDRRVLQDSPLLGDVWAAYAADPGGVQDLLIAPHKDATAAQVARRVSETLKRPAKHSAKIAYLQGIVGAELRFEEVLRVVVPLTQWWRQDSMQATLRGYERPDNLDRLRARLRALLAPERFVPLALRTGNAAAAAENFSPLERYIALAGLILWISALAPPRQGGPLPELKPQEAIERYRDHIAQIVDGMLQFYQHVQAATERAGAVERDPVTDPAPEAVSRPLIFQVSLNRRAEVALNRSVPAVKADAAQALFRVKCDQIIWAVCDSGINGRHPAFMTQQGNGKPVSRVTKTFDFTRIREITSDRAADVSDADLAAIVEAADISEADARKCLNEIAKDAAAERPTNWALVERLITLKTTDELPRQPASPHGSHVAGIIGADGAKDSANGYGGGMCPDIRLYDFRVLGRNLKDTEFAVIAALQYIRHINDRHNYIIVHGVNLSLSIPHNVRNYACGRTPICNECERLVESGVVVVAAAGNRGYQKFETSDGVFESYAAFSITDPGNSDGVITVGSTHGGWPQTYGVSFFSSRGPTGDGRLKPDLVAPGERVMSTVLGEEWGAESGTSMAAPHVSGAAAMLLARYEELRGQPRRVKQILCDSATDLGRERTFQGHGMLDVLRAFQSI